ncbi:MAG: hypothetical protein WCK98_01125 [bacterium]
MFELNQITGSNLTTKEIEIKTYDSLTLGQIVALAKNVINGLILQISDDSNRKNIIDLANSATQGLDKRIYSNYKDNTIDAEDTLGNILQIVIAVITLADKLHYNSKQLVILSKYISKRSEQSV